MSIKQNIPGIQLNKPKFTIGSMAQILNVHQRTLRIYDKKSVLIPDRTDGNKRYYTLDDIEKAKTILFLTNNLGVNLIGVKMLLALLDDNKMTEEEKLMYLAKIAKEINIDEQKQQENIKKHSKRGRKKKPTGAKLV